MTVSILEYSWMVIDVYHPAPEQLKLDPPVPNQTPITSEQVPQALQQCLASIQQEQRAAICDDLSHYEQNLINQDAYSRKTAPYKTQMRKYQQQLNQAAWHDDLADKKKPKPAESDSRRQLYAHGWIIVYEHDVFLGDGFFGRLYANQYTGDTVLAFRGTEPAKLDNLVADINLAMGKSSSVLNKGVEAYQHFMYDLMPKSMLKKTLKLYQDVKDYIASANENRLYKFNLSSKLNFTGHSLGGYLAQYVALDSSGDSQVVVFNAPSISGLKKLPFINQDDLHKPHTNFHYINIDNDQIHKIGTILGHEYILHGHDECNPIAIWKQSAIHSDPRYMGTVVMASPDSLNAYRGEQMFLTLRAGVIQTRCALGSEHSSATILEKLNNLTETAIDNIPLRPIE